MAGKQVGYQIKQYFEAELCLCEAATAILLQIRDAISTAAVSTQLLRTPARKGAHACTQPREVPCS